MKRVCKRLLSLLLVVSLVLSVTPSVYAVDDELYLSELRLVYAEDYDTAREILNEGEFKDYELLDENLNEDTDEIGVWLAYKTTDDIEDAITDMTVMQMDGGYSEGNYQQMLKESYSEYLKMGNIYLQAIDYFIEAYDSGDYMADVAFRQLNFFTVETEGNTTQKPHDFEGELLGDIFYNGIDVEDLATLFMQGNVYALQNVRSLLAMGVSYNEDGKTYVEKVVEAAAEMNDDPEIFDGEDLEDLLPNISAVLLSLCEQFNQLESVEDEFDWEDDVFTEDEIEFAEITLIATLMRDAEYLDGQSLYDFCKAYKNGGEKSKLYPLAVALNEGQAALTKVFHFYDVIRYSVTDMEADVIEEQLAEQEEIYAEEPFSLYAGVDRSIYDGSFALTTAAARANTMNEYSLEEILFGEAASLNNKIAASVGSVGLAMSVYALCRTLYYKLHLVDAADKAGSAANAAMVDSLKQAAESFDNLANQVMAGQGGLTYDQVLQNLIDTNADSITSVMNSAWDMQIDLNDFTTLSEKFDLLDDWAFEMSQAGESLPAGANDTLQAVLKASKEANKEAFTYDLNTSYSYSKVLYGGGTTLTTIMYIAGGVMMLYSAISLGISIYNYYHPDYDDIPTAMVDMIETVDGDRFIKYDVVFEAEAKKNGTYAAADLNAFEAQRWNALYYTKSYEAGQPLLADEFEISYNNNVPDEGYAPVRRFGEVVCYDLNKYNFDDDTPSIYLSVRQSEYQKSAVADVPDVIGSMFGTGMWFLAGGIGIMVGAGGTLAAVSMGKKKGKESEES